MKKIEMKRQVKFELNAWVSVLIFLGILVFVMMIAKNHHKQWDLTANKRFSLADQSVKILKSLKDPVEVKAYHGQEGETSKDKIKDLLQLYANESPRFQFDLIDMDRFPTKAKADNITIPGTVVMKVGKRKETVTTVDEERLTNALVKLTESSTIPVYFLKGHGEKSVEDFGAQGIGKLKDELMKQSFEARTLVLSQQKEVPKEATVIVVPGPRLDFLPGEIEQLKAYLAKGGRCVFMIDPAEKIPNLLRYLETLGFQFPKLALVDPLSKLQVGDAFILVVQDYAAHVITKDFKLQSLFPIARPIEKGKAPEGSMIENLVSSMPTTFGVAESTLSQKAVDLKNAKRGPFNVAMVDVIPLKEKEKPKAAEEGPAKKPEARVVVFGSSGVIENQFLNNPALPVGNKDLFLNTLSWLAERENLISIRPVESRSTPLMMSQSQGWMALLYCLLLLPGAVVLAGILMLFRRR